MSRPDTMYEAGVLLERIGEGRYRDSSAHLGRSDDEIAWTDDPHGKEAPARPSGIDIGVLRVGLIDAVRFSRECVQRTLERVHSTPIVHVYATASECVRTAAQNLDLLIYHPHGSEAQTDSLLHEVAALRHVFKDVPLVVMSDAEGDSAETIRETLRSGARGYIPTRTTGIDVAVEAIRLVRVGGTFALFDQLLLDRLGNAAAAPPLEAPPDYELTARQLAVLSHLRLGKANKIIAYELGMSESTVKVHVRNIMRKMGVTNRTQAAFRAPVPPDLRGARASRGS